MPDLQSRNGRRSPYLDKHIDHADMQSVLVIYKKALEDRVSVLRWGWSISGSCRESCAPGKKNWGGSTSDTSVDELCRCQDEDVPARRRIQPMPEDGGKKAGLHLSVIMNIVMLVAIIAMFVITLNSDQPNILNYERNLQNKYASWEQELTRREQTVREKERELHIENTENTGNTGNTETEVSQN